MTVTADKWLAASVQAVEDVLVQCATFRTMMGTSADASNWPLTRAVVRFQDYRTALAAPFTKIVLLPGSYAWAAGRKTPSHQIEVAVYLCWPIDNTAAGTDEKQQALTALNQLGNLLDEIGALLNTSTNLITAEPAFDPPERTPDDGTNKDCWDATLTFGIPI